MPSTLFSMKYLQHILYGIIISHWLSNVHGRLFPHEVPGRFAVVGMHSMRDEFILVGRYADRKIAECVCDKTGEWSECYIGLLYDLLDPDDRAEFERCKFSSVDQQDIMNIDLLRRSV